MCTKDGGKVYTNQNGFSYGWNIDREKEIECHDNQKKNKFINDMNLMCFAKF